MVKEVPEWCKNLSVAFYALYFSEYKILHVVEWKTPHSYVNNPGGKKSSFWTRFAFSLLLLAVFTQAPVNGLTIT